MLRFNNKMEHPIISKIKKEIERYEFKSASEEVGTVISVSDGVAEIEGLTKSVMSETVIFEQDEEKTLEDSLGNKKPVTGLVLNLEEEKIKIIKEGEEEIAKLAILAAEKILVDANKK